MAGGRPAEDSDVWKIRFARRNGGGSETVYRTSAEVAYSFAAQHRAAGTLLFFGKYELVNEVVGANGNRN